MKLTCKRCNHRWKTKKEVKPKICPRCKSTKWEQEKIRSWEKVGKLYVVLLEDKIKVGQAIIPERRINNIRYKKNKYVSYNCMDLNKCEKLLIKKATQICGKAIEGREFFKGGKKEYDKIVLYLKTVGDKSLINEHSLSKKNIADFDLDKKTKEMAVKPYLMMCLNERKEFVITLTEAIDDANNNICSYKKALDSVLTVANSMLLRVDKELKQLSLGENQT
ncbi:MAG: hypothetical protein U9Q21_04200 [Candidatus Auribacterota bacterium]|nr:hypothetical protein [Candidatus Auribacterota bacterium]